MAESVVKVDVRFVMWIDQVLRHNVAVNDIPNLGDRVQLGRARILAHQHDVLGRGKRTDLAFIT